MTLSRTIILLSTACVFMAPANLFADASQYDIMNWNTPCLKMTKKWSGYQGWKAIAVSGLFTNLSRGDALPYQECGHSWKASTKAKAEEAAMRRCNEGLRKGGGLGKAHCEMKTVQP